MKIIYMAYYFLPHAGGGTWTTYNLCKGLADLGNEVLLISPNVDYSMTLEPQTSHQLECELRIDIARVPRFRLSRRLGPWLCLPFMLWEVAKLGSSYHVIVCQFHPHHLIFLAAHLAKRILGLPLLARADDVRRPMGIQPKSLPEKTEFLAIQITNGAMQVLIPRTDRFLVPTRDFLRRMRPPFSQIPRSITALNENGFRQRENSEPEPEHECGHSLQAQDVMTLLLVGRFSGPEYGLDILLEAVDLLARQDCHKVRLLLVGDKPTKKQKNQICKLSASIVEIIDPQAPGQVEALIPCADICLGPIMPTMTTPLKVLEYMAAGKPVVTGIGSTSTQIAIDRKNILLVEPDPWELAQVLHGLMLDRKTAKRLGSMARKTVSRYHWDQASRKLDQETRKILHHALSDVPSENNSH